MCLTEFILTWWTCFASAQFLTIGKWTEIAFWNEIQLPQTLFWRNIIIYDLNNSETSSASHHIKIPVPLAYFTIYLFICFLEFYCCSWLGFVLWRSDTFLAKAKIKLTKRKMTKINMRLSLMNQCICLMNETFHPYFVEKMTIFSIIEKTLLLHYYWNILLMI